ncbi:FkbM family methyltransferase [Egbenema bharatensis]|uniref:FkbM family methyltransferase n=1 Tax=Egbenema bharatensis TaxID=3463334 RepID=UPI003A8AA2DD
MAEFSECDRDCLNVILDIHSADQYAALLILELLLSLDEGMEVHYYLQYGDSKSSFASQAVFSKFLKQKQVKCLDDPLHPGQQARKLKQCDHPVTSTEILSWNQLILQGLQQLNHFLVIDSSCVPLSRGWARTIYEAYLRRKQPIVGQVNQWKLSHTASALCFSKYAIYDCSVFKKLPIEQYFFEPRPNPWWSLRDRLDADPVLLTPTLAGWSTPIEYWLFSLYFQSLTGSDNPLDWPTNCLENRNDLVVDAPRITIRQLFEEYYNKAPMIGGVHNCDVHQAVLHQVRALTPTNQQFPIGGQFETDGMNQQSVISEVKLAQAFNRLRPDNSGLLSIADLRGQFAGKRCFIIGNGPSLKRTDLSLLNHEFTFGLNRIYLNYEAMGFEPTFYCCVNPNVIDQFAEEIDRLKSVKFVADYASSHLKNHWNTFFIKSVSEVSFNENLNNLQWHEGWTVTYCAMQVAFHLGFQEVILVGVDHYFKETGEPNQAVTAQGADFNHFHPDYFGKGVVWQYPDLERSEQSYRMAKEVYERNQRRILDATIGGHLQIFPKVDYRQMTLNNSQAQASSAGSHEPMDDLLNQQEKALLKRHPLPYPIFLPTQKFSLPERVEGLKRVVNIYENTYQSVYLPRLKALRSQFKDRKRAFVIGNGPSLNQTDLNLLRNEVTFGVNGIFLKFKDTDFRPTFYVVEDHLVAEDRGEKINQIQGPIKLFPIYLGYCLNEGDDTVFYNHIPRRSYPHGFDFSMDASEHTYAGCTVTFSCLQLAYYMGFKEIYLIGVDCNYEIPKDVEEKEEYSVKILDMKTSDPNHFDPDYFGKGYRWHDPQVDKMRGAYQEARKVCEANGVTIYNATIGGQLEVFPRVDYYSLFPQRAVRPRVLVIDITRIGDNSATGQMKQSMFGACPSEDLLQVYVAGVDELGVYSSSSVAPISKNYPVSDAASLLTECVRFTPDVIYYRPVADRPFLHDFACSLIDQLDVPTVIHIVDDWPERLRYQDSALYEKFDRSFRKLLNQAAARMSICQAMSTAFQQRYGVEFTAFANCIYPEDWESSEPETNGSQAEMGDRPFTIRYLGSLATDMTHDSVLDIARAVAELQAERSVQLEIYTTKYWKDRIMDTFASLPGVSVYDAEFGEAYRRLLKTADALLIAYNFDADSIRYVRYSMANKFPECLASGTPVLVYGPIDVATVAYAAETGCTQVLLERNSERLRNTIKELIDQPEYREFLGQAARQYAFKNHSASQIQAHFYGVLRSAVLSKYAASPKLTPEGLLQATRSLTFPANHLVFGGYERDRHAHIDETQIVAEWFASEPSDSIMVDVGAHYGTALKHFAERNWRVYAYEPDPDNRQALMQRVSNQPNVMIDNRAVSDRPGQVLPFFNSKESTGISGLSAFRDSHQQRCEVTTTTVAQICEEHHLREIDFLKIDTEGFDLMVLKGVPWDRVRPRVIECEFEDRKTVPLGYTFHDLAQYLVDRGYTVLVSEWHPVIRYGIRHDWYRLMTYPCQLDNTEAWGNLLAFREPPDLDQVAAIAQKLVTFRSAPAPVPVAPGVAQLAQSAQPATSPTHPLTHSPLSMQGSNGMSPIPGETQTAQTHGSNGKIPVGVNGKGSPSSQEQIPVVTTVSEPPPRLPAAFLRRIARYYSRWPLGVAVLAIALNTAATIDGVPFRWALSAGGSSLMLFLVGHAASKGDFALRIAEQAQETSERVSGSVNGAHQKATSAFKRATKANQRAQEALARLNGVSLSATTAMEAADRARNTAEFSQQKTNQATSNARSALETASRALGNAEFALEIANRAKDKADASLDMAEQVSARTDTTLERVDAVMKIAQQNSDRAESILETANRNAEKVSSLENQIKYVLKTNSANVGLFQLFDRQLSNESLETFISFWLPVLGLNVDRRALGYLAHRICLTEDTCSGRLATTVQDMLLRILVARSVQSRELSILEIGSLFGINLAILYETCRDFFDCIHLSAIDPLDGYYDKGKTDLITQVPITRSVFEHNMRQMDIPQEDMTLIQGLSTDEVVLQQAGQKQYNLLVIDGDHSYQGVKFDFDHYLAAVDVGGYIIFDDYSTEHWPEVADFVDQEVKSNPCVELVGSSWRTAVFRVVRKKLG